MLKRNGLHLVFSILCITDPDDSSLGSIRELAVHFEGIKILQESSLADGLGRLKDSRIDLVLVDLDLPDFEDITRFHGLVGGGTPVPVVAFSSDKGKAEKALGAGAQAAFYTGAANWDILIQTVHWVLREAGGGRPWVQEEMSSKRQRALLAINQAVQEMTQPEDLARVAEMCFDQLRSLDMGFCALAVQRVVDEPQGRFVFYELQPSGKMNIFPAVSPNLHRIWKEGKTLYRPDLDLDMGGLDPVDRKAISSRYGVSLRSILNVCYPEGVLSLLSDHPDPFPEGEIGFAEEVAQVLSVGMRRLEDLEHLDAVVRNVPDGLCLLDSARRLVFANTAAKSILKDLAGVDLGDELRSVGGCDLSEIEAMSDAPALEVSLGDGRLIEVGAKNIEEALAHRGWVVVLRDVTEEKEARDKLAQQERLAAIGQLASGIAHDFNNMLTVMVGYAQMLAFHPGMPDSAKHDLVEIFDQGQRGAQIIRQILDFSRPPTVDSQVMDLGPFIREAAKLFTRTLPENIQVQTQGPGEPFLVSADIARLHQVVTNLVLNARDAMAEGGCLTLEVKGVDFKCGEMPPAPGMEPGAWVELGVADTGVGMPPDVVHRVFEPFFSTKEKGEGTGLGLSQVYGIGKEHGWFILVDSVVGKGTRFSVFMPRISEETTLPALEAQATQGSGQTILVVEDDPKVLRSLQNMLSFLGYRVLSASLGKEACSLFDAQACEIQGALVDLMMPDCSGLDVLEHIRARNPDFPVAIMTGYTMAARGNGDRIKRASAVVEKPINLYVISGVLAGMLKG